MKYAGNKKKSEQKKMRYARKNVLVIEYTSLPKNLKEIIRDWCGFGNDCILPLRSEFQPSRGETWESTLTRETLNRYHQDWITRNDYKGDLKQFITDCGLTVDVYLIDQNFDLKGIEEIYIDISW